MKVLGIPRMLKKVGESLLAAWNWQFIWKEHFADFALAEVRKPKEKEMQEPKKDG